MRIRNLKSLVFSIPLAVLAQTPALEMSHIYQCPGGQAFEVFSCAGPGATDACDVQTFQQGQALPRGKAPRQQVMLLFQICQLPQGGARGGAAAAPGQARSQVGPGGFKAGDKVQILTAGGWMDAQVSQVNGNSYMVHAANGADVTKSYPAELRRIGKLTAEDHANGQWDLHDNVQVNVNGKWMPGVITGYFNQDFDVKVEGGSVHTNVQNLRPYTPPPVAVRPPTQAPKAGLTSCGAKFEGRWEPSNGMGGMKLVFRSGKVTVTVALDQPEELECWTDGKQVHMYKAGSSTAETFPIDINNDGTLQTPLAELKKKGN